MKALILTTALAISAALSNAQQPVSKTNDDPVLKEKNIEVAILQRTNDQVTVLMEKEPRELVKIKVYEGKKLLFTQRVKKKTSANIKFDISEFPVGEYVIEVEKDNKVIKSATVLKGGEVLAGNN